MIDILIIEDDRELRTMLVYLLSEVGNFKVDSLNNGVDAIQVINNSLPKLIILDLNLPGKSGIDILKSLRANFICIPVIMITANDSELVETNCLLAGANDYITKPIRSSVLLERVKRQLAQKEIVNEKSELNNNIVYLNENNHSIIYNGAQVKLAPSEYEILYILSKNKKPVSVSDLFEIIHGFNHDPIDRSVYMRISSLKKKVRESIPDLNLVKNIRSKGFYLGCNVDYL
tara:strand:+ start:4475 stop:5167 length:693 start_codon:yes stop_codon:yes gene_type:complete